MDEWLKQQGGILGSSGRQRKGKGTCLQAIVACKTILGEHTIAVSPAVAGLTAIMGQTLFS